jgi:tetracycline repressor-like protein
MLAASDTQTELSKSFRNHFIGARREEGRALLERAIEAGEVWRGIHVDATLDLLYGAVFYRLIAAPANIDSGYSDRIVAILLASAELH